VRSTFQMLLNDPDKGELEVLIDEQGNLYLTRRGASVIVTTDEVLTLYRVLERSYGSSE
jgi:hypothetical protein